VSKIYTKDSSEPHSQIIDNPFPVSFDFLLRFSLRDHQGLDSALVANNDSIRCVLGVKSVQTFQQSLGRSMMGYLMRFETLPLIKQLIMLDAAHQVAASSTDLATSRKLYSLFIVHVCILASSSCMILHFTQSVLCPLNSSTTSYPPALFFVARTVLLFSSLPILVSSLVVLGGPTSCLRMPFSFDGDVMNWCETVDHGWDKNAVVVDG